MPDAQRAADRSNPSPAAVKRPSRLKATALRRLLGDEHSNTLSSMNNLSEALGALGDHAGARELHELVRDSAGPPGQLTARSHNRRSRALAWPIGQQAPDTS